MVTLTVQWIGDGTNNNPRRPNLSESASYTVVQDHGDGTCTVEVNDPQAAERELQELRETIDTLTLALLELEP